MIRQSVIFIFIIAVGLILFSCGTDNNQNQQTQLVDTVKAPKLTVPERLKEYASIPLTTDLSKLSEKEKQMIPLLINACKIMDEIFWMQAFGSKDSLFSKLTNDDEKKLCEINYGPWDRLTTISRLLKLMAKSL
jgi:hypothetical protein